MKKKILLKYPLLATLNASTFALPFNFNCLSLNKIINSKYKIKFKK